MLVDQVVLGVVQQVEQEIDLGVPYGFWFRGIDALPELFLRQWLVAVEHLLE